MHRDSKASSSTGSIKRLWIPVLVMFAYSAVVGWLTWTESMFRNAAVLALGILAVFLSWIWWTFASGLKRSAMAWSFGLGVASIGVVALVFSKWVRYDGSADGSALPKLAWVWTATPDQRLEQNGAPRLASETPSVLNEMKEVPGLHLDSPQYLGQQRNGEIDGVTLATNWDVRPPERLWAQPIGLGWSSFAVAGMIAITQEQRGEEEWVSCYDLGTGKLLWVHSDQTRFSESMGSDGPRATPTVTGERVVTMGATGILNCLNLKDGTLNWTHDVLVEHQQRNLEWGKSASPLILESEGLVVVTAGREGTPTVLAYRLDSGEPNWSWGGDAASYSSPIETTLLGVRQVISVNENTVVGLEPDTGKELWIHRWPRGISDSTAKAAQPQVVGDHQVLLTASYGVGSLLIEVARDDQGVWTTSEAWRAKGLMKTKFSSTCVKNQYAYGIDEGVFACLDLKTGRRVWKGGRYGYGQNILVGDHLLIQAEDGSVALVAADPAEHRVLASFQAIKGKTWNVPTLAGQFLLVRNDAEAACFRLPLQRDP